MAGANVSKCCRPDVNVQPTSRELKRQQKSRGDPDIKSVIFKDDSSSISGNTFDMVMTPSTTRRGKSSNRANIKKTLQEPSGDFINALRQNKVINTFGNESEVSFKTSQYDEKFNYCDADAYNENRISQRNTEYRSSNFGQYNRNSDNNIIDHDFNGDPSGYRRLGTCDFQQGGVEPDVHGKDIDIMDFEDNLHNSQYQEKKSKKSFLEKFKNKKFRRQTILNQESSDVQTRELRDSINQHQPTPKQQKRDLQVIYEDSQPNDFSRIESFHPTTQSNVIKTFDYSQFNELTQGLDEALLDKENIEQMQFTLGNLVNILIPAFKILDQSEIINEKIILALGNTGCGKSTMLNSLVWGPQSLQVQTINEEYEVTQKNNTKMRKQNTRQVICKVQNHHDQSDFAQGELINNFSQKLTIGHSKNQSQTFLPDFIKDPENNLIYADVAGFRDTGGSLVELVNCFIIKEIFRRSKTVRFLIPLTLPQIIEGRGADAKNLIGTLRYMCQVNLSTMAESMQPLLVKCKPPVDEYSSNELDIDLIRADLMQQFEKEINALRVRDDKVDDSVDDQIEDIRDSQISATRFYYQRLHEFHKTFAVKIEIFDPLDREFPIQEEQSNGEMKVKDQGFKCAQLKQELLKMEGVKGSDLCLPLCHQLNMNLQNLFQQEQAAINSLADYYIKEAQKQAKNYVNDFCEKQQLQNYEKILSFMEHFKLTEDARSRFQKFRIFKRRTCDQIQKSMFYNQMSKIGQKMHWQLNQLYKYLNNKQWENVVKQMIDVKKLMINLRNQEKLENIEDQAAIDLQISNTDRCIEDIVTEIGTDPVDLIGFAYQLRKQDKDDQYSYNFLNGQIRPPLLVNIILSNRWNENRQEMEIMPRKGFRMTICNNKLLECSNSEELVKVGKIHHQKDHDGHTNLILFLLCPKGIQIKAQSKKKSFTLVSQGGGQIMPGEFQWMEWADRSNPLAHQEYASTWLLIPHEIGSTDPYFFFEMNYGEKRPRLISNREDVKKNSKVIVTTREADGYQNKEQATWKVFEFLF